MKIIQYPVQVQYRKSICRKSSSSRRDCESCKKTENIKWLDYITKWLIFLPILNLDGMPNFFKCNIISIIAWECTIVDCGTNLYVTWKIDIKMSNTKNAWFRASLPPFIIFWALSPIDIPIKTQTQLLILCQMILSSVKKAIDDGQGLYWHYGYLHPMNKSQNIAMSIKYSSQWPCIDN